MSGENELQPQKQESQVEKWDRILDEYESSISLSPWKAPGETEELESYLCMDRSQIEALPSTDAITIALRLQQFAFHIQRSQNRENARMNWAAATIKSQLADDVQNYTGHSYEERLNRAIKGNEVGKKLNSIKIYAQQRSDRLNFLAASIKSIADVFKSVYYSKLEKRGDRDD